MEELEQADFIGSENPQMNIHENDIPPKSWIRIYNTPPFCLECPKLTFNKEYFN